MTTTHPTSSPPNPDGSSPNTPTIDDAAFHGLAGDIVRALHPYTEADPVGVLSSLLAAVGNAVGTGPHWTVSGCRHGLRVNTVLVGETGVSRKGTAWSAAQIVLREAAPGWSNTCVSSGLSSGEGLIQRVRDPLYKQEPVREDGRRTGAIIDYETRLVDEGVADKRLLVVEEEFSRVLKVKGRDGSTLSEVIRKAWDSGDLNVMTKQPYTATGAHISVSGHITYDELRDAITRTDLLNGFANRFLWVRVTRSKLLPDGDSPPAETIESLGSQLRAALEDGSQEFEFKRSADAARLWREEMYHALTAARPGPAAPVLNRADPTVMRLACIYAVLDRASTVAVGHLVAAKALWDYCEHSAEFIFGDAASRSIAQRIEEEVRARGSLTRTEIRDLFNRNETEEAISAAVRTLVERGSLDSKKISTGGRPATVLVPAERSAAIADPAPTAGMTGVFARNAAFKFPGEVPPKPDPAETDALRRAAESCSPTHAHDTGSGQ